MYFFMIFRREAWLLSRSVQTIERKIKQKVQFEGFKDKHRHGSHKVSQLKGQCPHKYEYKGMTKKIETKRSIP